MTSFWSWPDPQPNFTPGEDRTGMAATESQMNAVAKVTPILSAESTFVIMTFAKHGLTMANGVSDS